MNRKRWIVRLCWLAAWSSWAWIGVGLHRELPREFVPALLKLEINEDDQPLGIIGNEAVVTQWRHSLRASTYKVWRVEDGTLARRTEGPSYAERSLLRHGLAVGLHPEAGGANPQKSPFQCLDLLTGEWTPLGSALMELLAVDSDKPWLALKVDGDEDRTISLQVFDAEKREFLFRQSVAAPRPRAIEKAVHGWFRNGGLEILWGRKSTPETGSVWSFRIERWEVATQSLVSTTPLEGKRPWLGSTEARNRMVMRKGNNGETVNVVDARTLETVFSVKDVYDGQAEWHMQDRGRANAILSRDGRRLLTPVGDLWDVESGRRIWRRDPKFEAILNRQLPDGRFTVLEDWKVWCERFGLSTEWSTVAVRSLETGGVDYRVWEFPFGPDCMSDDRSLAVDREGAIHRMPPPANWRLLAICQAVLAAPLVLFWAVLRWRRRKSPGIDSSGIL